MIAKSQVPTLNQLLKWALLADQGNLGDVTTNSLLSQQTATAKFIVKDNFGVVSGLDLALKVLKTQDAKISFKKHKMDGDQVHQGDILATVQGPAKSILSAERVALEFLRRMSGIATQTSLFVTQAKDTNCQILDTRKIMPLWGQLDKKAVRDGGGHNHRQDLSGMGLIKNNHLDVLNGNIEKAIQSFKNKYPNIPLEIEVRNQKELLKALRSNPDRILLDNMDDQKIKESVNLRNQINPKVKLEASGNMSLKRIKVVAKTGVDYISVGALTHSVTAFDISLHIAINK